MDGIGALEGEKRLDGLSGFFLGAAQVAESLEVEPELGAGAEEMGEAQGGIAGDAAGAVEDLRDAVGGHAELAGEFGGAHVERLQFFGQMFAGMDCGECHSDSTDDNRESRSLINSEPVA